MAERPVFVPVEKGSRLVDEIPVRFAWNPGMAPSQKKKNVVALHASAARRGLMPLLEISSKSDDEVGQRLSAFSLSVKVHGKKVTVESAYQGSKIFERGGPYYDLYGAEGRIAKRDARLKESGRLIGFRFMDSDYPVSPTTVFYDWLYVSALYPYREWLKRLHRCAGFTDIEFNPVRSLNCQARSFATFVALEKRGVLQEAIHSFDSFRDFLQGAMI
jgi:hypothetical protein